MEEKHMDLAEVYHGMSVLDLYCSVHEVYEEEETQRSSKQRRRKSSGSRRTIAPSALKKKTPPSRKRSRDYTQCHSGVFSAIAEQLNVKITPHRTRSGSDVIRKKSIGAPVLHDKFHTMLREKNCSIEDDHELRNSRRFSFNSGANTIKGTVEGTSSLKDFCHEPFDARMERFRRKSAGAAVCRKTSFDPAILTAKCKRFRKNACLSPVQNRQ